MAIDVDAIAEVTLESTTFPAKSIQLHKLLDFQEDKRDEMPQKEVLGKEPPTHEADAYLNYPRTVILECRLTTAERNLLYDIDDDGSTVYLNIDPWLFLNISLNYAIVYECWIEKIETSYRNVESVASPWRVLIYLVVVSIAYYPPDDDILYIISLYNLCVLPNEHVAPCILITLNNLCGHGPNEHIVACVATSVYNLCVQANETVVASVTTVYDLDVQPT